MINNLDGIDSILPDVKAAMDSLRFLPKSVVGGGTLEIVTIECRLAPGFGAGACESVAKNACSIGDGPDPSPPLSDSRRT